jgi:hypothetical protein
MNTTSSTPTRSASPKGRFGRTVLVAAVGSVVLASAVAGSFMARGNSNEAASPAPAVVQQSTPSFTVSHATGGYTPHTIYIVGSQEQAAQISAAIDQANLIRSNINESPLTDEVIVAVSQDRAAAIVSAETDANGILASLYGVENRIADLRG